MAALSNRLIPSQKNSRPQPSTVSSSVPRAASARPRPVHSLPPAGGLSRRCVGCLAQRIAGCGGSRRGARHRGPGAPGLGRHGRRACAESVYSHRVWRREVPRSRLPPSPSPASRRHVDAAGNVYNFGANSATPDGGHTPRRQYRERHVAHRSRDEHPLRHRDGAMKAVVVAPAISSQRQRVVAGPGDG